MYIAVIERAGTDRVPYWRVHSYISKSSFPEKIDSNCRVVMDNFTNLFEAFDVVDQHEKQMADVRWAARSSRSLTTTASSN
jgi:hypothetical protein